MNVSLFLEIKNEYTEHLVDTITPYIYEGLTSIYSEASKIARETNCEDKTLIIFQKLLQSITGWNQFKISEETSRIKQSSNTAEYLDDLVKAVIKSNIILLSYSNSISNIIAQTFYNSLQTSVFIHQCYIECGKDAHNNPYLFYSEVSPLDYKRNQLIIHEHIQSGIVRAIRKILPIATILKEYLINSVNIIQEPPRVELIGVPGSTNPDNQDIQNTLPAVLPTALPAAIVTGNLNNNNNNNNNNNKLEKEVMKIIASDSVKSDREKIQAIMSMHKKLTSQEPIRPGDISASSSVNSKSRSKINPKVIAPILLDNDDNDEDNDDNNYNGHLDATDKKIINLNFDNEPTNDGSKNTSVSATSLNSAEMPPLQSKKAYSKTNPETSERIDPTQVKLIEDYGTGMIYNGGTGSHKSKSMSKSTSKSKNKHK